VPKTKQEQLVELAKLAIAHLFLDWIAKETSSWLHASSNSSLLLL
jgi:hypothetical protein